MPYVPHLRLTFGGTLGQPQVAEEWSCGLAIGGPGTDLTLSPPPDVAYEGCVENVGQWFQDDRVGIARHARLQWVKLALVNAQNRYVGDARMTEGMNYSPSQVGIGAFHPFQTARVITLGTGQRGASKRGRIFAPVPNALVDDEGLTTPESASGCAAATAVFLSNLNDHFPGTSQVVIASSKGYNTAVTTVSVGRVLDTMRSRRTSLDERYTAPIAIVDRAH